MLLFTVISRIIFLVAIHLKSNIDRKDTTTTPANKRQYNDFNMERFNTALSSDNRFSSVLDFCNLKDPNAAYNCFHNVYKELFDKHFAIKIMSRRKKNVPINEWITKGLVKFCNKKSLL